MARGQPFRWVKPDVYVGREEAFCEQQEVQLPALPRGTCHAQLNFCYVVQVSTDWCRRCGGGCMRLCPDQEPVDQPGSLVSRGVTHAGVGHPRGRMLRDVWGRDCLVQCMQCRTQGAHDVCGFGTAVCPRLLVPLACPRTAPSTSARRATRARSSGRSRRWRWGAWVA